MLLSIAKPTEYPPMSLESSVLGLSVVGALGVVKSRFFGSTCQKNSMLLDCNCCNTGCNITIFGDLKMTDYVNLTGNRYDVKATPIVDNNIVGIAVKITNHKAGSAAHKANGNKSVTLANVNQAQADKLLAGSWPVLMFVDFLDKNGLNTQALASALYRTANTGCDAFQCLLNTYSFNQCGITIKRNAPLDLWFANKWCAPQVGARPAQKAVKSVVTNTNTAFRIVQ